MTTMSFICDYAKISPVLTMYKVDSKVENSFSTFEDIDEDTFVLHVFPMDTECLSPADSAKIAELVNPYLFKD